MTHASFEQLQPEVHWHLAVLHSISFSWYFLCKTARFLCVMWPQQVCKLRFCTLITKAKTYETCIVPQATYHSCSGTVHITDRPGIQPIARRLCLRPQTLTYDQTAIRSPRLLFNGLHSHNPWLHDYYSYTDPGGMEGWVGLVGWPIADTLHTKWPHVNHISGIDQEGKSASQKRTS